MVQAEKHPIIRRTLISGIAAVASTGTAVLPTLPCSRAQEAMTPNSMQLYEDLRRAWALQNSLDVTLTDEEFDAGGLDAAFNACSAIVDQIEQCRATTIEGLRAKALAILWSHSGDMKFHFDDDPTRHTLGTVDPARFASGVARLQRVLRAISQSKNRPERCVTTAPTWPLRQGSCRHGVASIKAA